MLLEQPDSFLNRGVVLFGFDALEHGGVLGVFSFLVFELDGVLFRGGCFLLETDGIRHPSVETALTEISAGIFNRLTDFLLPLHAV